MLCPLGTGRIEKIVNTRLSYCGKSNIAFAAFITTLGDVNYVLTFEGNDIYTDLHSFSIIDRGADNNELLLVQFSGDSKLNFFCMEPLGPK